MGFYFFESELMKKIVGVICAFLSLSTAAAQTVTLKSDLVCRDWLESRKLGTSEVLEEHFVGWMNGYAWGTFIDVWNTPKQISREQLFWHIDTYCRQNPSKDAFAAMLDLFSVHKKN